MDSDIKLINDDEQLVCYFEDGSLYGKIAGYDFILCFV